MIGKKLKNYKLLQIIGEGGMSTVYLSRHVDSGSLAAIKVLKRAYTQDQDHLKRFFEREIKTTRALDHPNIVKLLDSGKKDNIYYLVYEFIDGLTLDKYIKSKKLSVKEIENITLKILAGLSHAHSRGVIHRDIKPQNILITKDGKVKITDFGIAKAISSTTITQTGMFMGSPGYVSPEQADGKKVGPASDLYSFGVLLFEMLLKRLPFTSDTPWGIVNKHINEVPPDISKIVKDIPSYLSYIVAKCLVKSPSGRFSSADEIMGVLKDRSFATETVIRDFRTNKAPEDYNISTPLKKKSSNTKKVWIAIGSVAAFFIIISIIISVTDRANRRVDNYREEKIVVEAAEEATEEEAVEEVTEETTDKKVATEEKATKEEALESKIVFSSNSDGYFDIYIMDSDGANVVPLTDNDSDNYIIGGWK